MFYGSAILTKLKEWDGRTDGQTNRQDATSNAASYGRSHNKSPIMIK